MCRSSSSSSDPREDPPEFRDEEELKRRLQRLDRSRRRRVIFHCLWLTALLAFIVWSILQERF